MTTNLSSKNSITEREVNRRHFLGFGTAVVAAAVIGPLAFKLASSSPASATSTIGINLIGNSSFEDDVPGPTAPSWTFTAPPPL